MTTENKNLSHYKLEEVPSAKGMKIGIVVSEWNANITEKLFSGAYEALLECGCNSKNIIKMYLVALNFLLLLNFY